MSLVRKICLPFLSAEETCQSLLSKKTVRTNQSACVIQLILWREIHPIVSLGIRYDLHVYLSVYHRGDLWCIKSILLLIYTSNFFLTSFFLDKLFMHITDEKR